MKRTFSAQFLPATLLSLALTALPACGSDSGDDDSVDASVASGDGAVVDASSTQLDAAGPDSATPDSGTPGAFTLTSTTIVMGQSFPSTHTCALNDGDVSPALTWTAGPAGTMSYAVIFTDMSNNLIHWAIWDIPATPGVGGSLPQGVMTAFAPNNVTGAEQAISFDGQTRGYLGPCPSGQLHTYQFVVYAVNVPSLTALGMTTTRTQARTAVQAAMLGSASLSGTSNASRP